MKKSLRQNFKSLITWSVASQFIAVASVPVLSRLFSPDAYGKLAIFTSVSTILGSMLTLRLEWHIPNCKTREAANALALSAVLICTALIVPISMAAQFVGLYGRMLPAGVDIGYSGLFVAAVAIYVLLQALDNVAVSYCVLNGDMTRLGRARFLRQISIALFAIILFFYIPGSEGLIVATVAGLAVGTGYLIRKSPVASALRMTKKKIKRGVRVLRAVYRRVFVSSMVSINNTFSYELVPIVLVAYFSPAVAGLYFMSRRLLSKPITLVTSSMSSSFWSYAAAQYKSDPQVLYQKYLSLTGKLLLLCIPFLLAVWMFSSIAPAVLGDEWSEISGALLAVTPMSIGALAFSGLGHLIVLRKQHYQLGADFARLTLMIGTTWYAAHLGLGGTMAIFMIAMSSLVGHLLFFAAHVVAYRNLGIRKAVVTASPI